MTDDRGSNGARRRRLLVFVPMLLGAAMVAGVLYWLFAPLDPKYAEDRAVEAALTSAIQRAGPRGSFDLATVTTFPWDRAYMLGAYSGPELFEEREGFSWRGLATSASNVQDRYQLIVFVKDRTVHWCDHDRVNGELAVGSDPIRRSDSVLDVSTTPQSGTVVTRHDVPPPVWKMVHKVNGQVVEVDPAQLEHEFPQSAKAMSTSQADGGH